MWFCVMCLFWIYHVLNHRRVIMRWAMELFFLLLTVHASYLHAYRDNFEDSRHIDKKNSIKIAGEKSPGELTFDRVWKAYNKPKTICFTVQ